MNELGRLESSERPYFVLTPRVIGIAFGNVEGIRAGLKLRGGVSAADVDSVKLDMAIAVEDDSLIGIGVEGLSPEVKTEVPFGAVELSSVEFVSPDELPIAVGEI